MKQPRNVWPVGSFVCALLSLVLAATSFPADAWAGSYTGQSFRMEGNAPGTGQRGFSRAIENAAVGILAEFLENTVGTTDFSPFGPLFERAGEYIRSYRVLTHQDEGDIVRVEIDAYVFERRLREDIARLSLAQTPAPPKVVLLIANVYDDEYTLDLRGTAFQEISTSLTDKHFRVVPVETIERLYEPEQLLGIVTGTDEKAARMARENLADAAIIGIFTATSDGSTANSSILRNQVSVVIKVIRSTDAVVLATTTAEAAIHSQDPSTGMEQAIRDVCMKVDEEIGLAVALSPLGPDAEHQVIVELSNIRDLNRVDAITEQIKTIWGVEGVEVLVSTQDLARIRVRYDGPMGVLVDQVSSYAYDDFRLIVRRVVERDVELIVTD